MSDLKNPQETTPKEAKILPFPAQRKTSERIQQIANQRRKVVLSGALVSILLIAVFTHDYLQRRTLSIQDGRQLASIGRTEEPYRDVEWEKKIAEKIADEKDFVYGDKATDLEQLRFGVLEGKYALRLNGDRLEDIEFVSSSREVPKFINDRHSFLMDHKDLFSLNYTHVKLLQSKLGDSTQEELYSLFDDHNVQVGKVAFHFDDEGRMLRLIVEKN